MNEASHFNINFFFLTSGYQDEFVDVITYDNENIRAVTLKTVNSQYTKNKTLASQRYMNIIVEGAKFHKLDPEYIKWLESIPYYDPSGWRRKAGRVAFVILFLGLALPFLIAMLLSMTCRIRSPRIVYVYMQYVSRAIWFIHDNVMQLLFTSGANNDDKK